MLEAASLDLDAAKRLLAREMAFLLHVHDRPDYRLIEFRASQRAPDMPARIVG